jgi:hypothetical protein
MFVKLRNNSGISIVETLIALALLVGVAMSSSYFLTTTNNIKSKTNVKATIDQIHVLQIQRARNSNQVKQSVRDSIAPGLITNFQNCFDGSFDGTGCNSVAASDIPQTYAEAIVDGGDADAIEDGRLTGFENQNFAMFGEGNLFESRAYWYATCPSADRCTSIDVRITTQVKAGSSLDGKLEPRVTTLTFPQQLFMDQKRTGFQCLATGPGAPNQIVFGINNLRNRATCLSNTFATAAQVQCATNYPMANFGTVTAFPADRCNTPDATNCSAGVNRGYGVIALNSRTCRTR